MSDQTVAQLEHVKRLLILLLIKFGADSKEIGMALGVDGSAIRRMMPGSGIKRITFGSET